ncbi:unnamed protein product [Owenia fusiformis]|uniref:Uncharacterized protein n=1 Tax=Owenia fusiformis TaxID=6347 RepID=A0A8J1UNQ2_OWEFU|nr:unnamed protein product [Owenia fusiformis]
MERLFQKAVMMSFFMKCVLCFIILSNGDHSKVVFGLDFYCLHKKEVNVTLSTLNLFSANIITKREKEDTYRNNEHCTWIVDSGSFNKRIKVDVLSSFLQWAPTNAICNSYDYMEIYDGRSEVNRLLVSWCNKESEPTMVISSGRFLFIRFKTNSQNPYSFLGIELQLSSFEFCPRGWIATSNNCYYHSGSVLGTWTRARKQCNLAQANLPVFYDMPLAWDEFTNYIMAQFPQNSQSWIGLYDEGDGVHKWLDGIIPQENKFNPSWLTEYGADCVTVEKEQPKPWEEGPANDIWWWRQRPCDNEKQYVCVMEKSCPMWIHSPSTTIPSTTDKIIENTYLQHCKDVCEYTREFTCKSLHFTHSGVNKGHCELSRKNSDFHVRTLDPTKPIDLYEHKKCVTEPLLQTGKETELVEGSIPSWGWGLIYTAVGLGALVCLICIPACTCVACNRSRKKHNTENSSSSPNYEPRPRQSEMHTVTNVMRSGTYEQRESTEEDGFGTYERVGNAGSTDPPSGRRPHRPTYPPSHRHVNERTHRNQNLSPRNGGIADPPVERRTPRPANPQSQPHVNDIAHENADPPPSYEEYISTYI